MFVAMAFSISATQILLGLLFLLTLPWPGSRRRLGASGRLPGSAREAWAATGALRRQPLTRPFLALGVLTLLSALSSGDPGWSLWIARDLLRVAIFYLVLWHTRDAAHALRLWQGFLVALTVMACYGLAQAWVCRAQPDVPGRAWLVDLCVHPSRINGPFSIYMTFGGVLLLGALFFVAYLANVPWRRAWWMVPAGTVTVAALALTYSRNAWLGLAAGSLGLVLTARRGLRIVVILLGIALVVGLLSPGAVTQRVRSMADLQDQTVRDRVAMWRSGLAMIADHPLLGVGPGEVRAWYPQYRRPEAIRPSTGHLHNSAIQIAAERGLPALAAWLWLWVVFFREGRRILARVGKGPSLPRALVCASLGGTVGFLVAGLFEHNFGDGEVVMLVYALMALPFVIERETAPSPPGRATRAP
jgi:O-antigen ligase